MKTRREGPPRAGGYTLVELACVLCIAGIMASLALPSLDGLVLDQRRAAVVNELVVTLMLARSEALKRGGRPLVACGVEDRDGNGRLEPQELACAGYDWSGGWVLGTWDDANGDARVDAGELGVLRTFQPGAGVTVTAGNFTASPPVKPAGTLLIKSFGKRTSNGTLTVCDRRGAGAARGVIVSSLGRARVSDRRADGSALRCP